MSNEINDIREPKELRVQRFSLYKKSDVKKQLTLSIIQGNIEQSFYWSAELVCSGAFMDLWETIILIISKNIHLGNPLLPTYVELQFNQFKNIVTNGYIGNELAMRNNERIRKLFAQIIAVLCYSPKRHSFDTVKINKPNDYDLTKLTSKLVAPNTSYGNQVFRPEDPKELFMAINELAFSLSNSRSNIIDACFWVEWILEYESECKTNKKNLTCERREEIKVNEKFQKDVIWLVWDTIVITANIQKNTITTKVVNSLLNLFSLHYGAGCKKKRRYLIYFAISIVVDNYNPHTSIIHNKELIQEMLLKVDIIYKQIKKNEKTPKTDYLFNNTITPQTNLEKTIEKMDILNDIL